MTPGGPERAADQAKTWPIHDCQETLHHHFHNQDDAQWTTCETCDRIVAFRWKQETDALAQAVQAEREVERLRGALDIGTLRRYHDLSFADPPSYHEPNVENLWDCPQCVERFIERGEALLPRRPAPDE